MAKTKAAKRGKRRGLLRTVERLGVNRGLVGGNKGWFYVGSGLWTLRTVRRMAERKSEILISEKLASGQRLIIANGRATVEEAEARGVDLRDPEDTTKVSRKEAKAEAKRSKKAAAKGAEA